MSKKEKGGGKVKERGEIGKGREEVRANWKWVINHCTGIVGDKSHA